MLNLTTAGSIPPTSPTNVVATATSGTQITVNWSPPSTGTPTSYLIFRGTSSTTLAQVAVRGACTTCSYNDFPLIPGTKYYYGVEASAAGVSSPMSALTTATTYPLPTTPTNVTATATSDSQIKVTWAPSSGGGLAISSYTVLEGTVAGLLHSIATVNGTVCVGSTCTYAVKSLTPSTTYYFEVQASDSGGGSVSLPSLPALATTPAVPSAPTNLVMTANSATRITVTWSETIPPNGLAVTQYLIFCGTAAPPTTQVGTTATKSFTYNGLTAGTKYFCAAEAVDADRDDSALSATANSTTAALPNAPTGVTAVANSSTRVTLSWTASTVPPNGLPISSYKIYRGTSPSSLANVSTRTASPYVDTTVTANTTYYYALVAADTGGDNSAQSAIAHVTTPTQPGAATNVGAVANSSTQVTVTWTAPAVPPNGLPISNYQIYRGTSASGLSKVGTRTGPPYVDTTVTAGTGYYYAIVTVDTDLDDSPQSDEAQASTP